MIKKSMRINGHRTSVALEEIFWEGLDRLVREKQSTPPKIIAMIDATRNKDEMSLAAAIRVFLYNYAVQGLSR
jgi:predicted DNA-binding ribbon-helix-helix protein